MATVDSDRDDIGVDTSREAMIRRVVLYVADYATGGYDPELSAGPPPTVEQIESRARGATARLALRLASSLIWPAADHDAYAEPPIDFVPLVIARARELCGV